LDRLEKAKAAYDRYPGLYAFMRSAVLVGLGQLDRASAEKIIDPDKSKSMALAHHGLLAQALEQAKRYREARPHWLAMRGLAETEARVQLALGRNYLLAGDLGPLLAEKRAAPLQEILREGATLLQLEVAADDITLPGETRRTADRLLLGRYLLMGAWKKYAARIEQSPNRKELEPVETAVKSLAEDPAEPKGLLNVGYFIESRTR
jgi:hypothetical protein